MNVTENGNNSHTPGSTRMMQRHYTWSESNIHHPASETKHCQRKTSLSQQRSGWNTALSRSQSLVAHMNGSSPLTRSFNRRPTQLLSSNTCLSQDHSDALEGLNAEDGSCNSSLWGEFEEHIHSIDTDSVQFQVKPTTSKGSHLFKEAMQEEYKNKQAFGRTVGKAVGVHKFKDNLNSAILREEEEEEEEGLSDVMMTSADGTQATNTANRCWNKVKIDLQEQRLESKLAEETTGWNLVQRTNFNINDPSDIRQELYDKYLKHSHQWWLKGLNNYEKYKYFFDEDCRDPNNNAQQSSKKKRVVLSGKDYGKSQSKQWLKSLGNDSNKRPVTSRPGYSENEALKQAPHTARPMTAFESGS